MPPLVGDVDMTEPISEKQFRSVIRAFESALRKVGLEPADEQAFHIMASMVGGHYGMNGGGAELTGFILREIEDVLDHADKKILEME